MPVNAAVSIPDSLDTFKASESTAAVSKTGFRQVAILPVGISILILTSVFIYTLSVVKGVVGTTAFGMDDAWIHVTIARNLAEGNGYGIVPGRFLSLSTSPTWTLLVSFVYYFTHDPIISTFLVSFLSSCAAVIFCYLLTAELTGSTFISTLASILLVMNAKLVWGMGSGMEIPLSVAAITAFFFVYYAYPPDSNTRRYIVPLILGFACITRPECFALIPLVLLDTAWQLSREKKFTRSIISTGFTQSLVIFLSLLPYFALNILSHGKIFPTTYYAKTIVRGVGLVAALKAGTYERLYQSFMVDGPNGFFSLAQSFLNQNLLLFIFASAGLLVFTKAVSLSSRSWLLPITLIFLPYLMGINAPLKDFSTLAQRYYTIFVPLITVLGASGLWVLAQYGKSYKAAILLGVCMIFLTLRTIPWAAHRLAIDADSTERLYVRSGEWLNQNLPANAVIGLNDIGGIAYFTKRNLIDVMGLASPEIWPALQRSSKNSIDIPKMKEFLKQSGVTHLVLNPTYYPELTADKETFREIKSWKEKYNHGRAISPQVLYEVHW